MRGLIRGAIALAMAGAVIHAGGARAEDCPDLATGELGIGLIEHSCFHTTNGPFATVTATPGDTAVPATANLDAVHTHYLIALDPAQPSVVTYLPVRSGNWAIFGATDVPHTLLDTDGREVPVLRTHAVAACPAIPLVRIYALAALTRYTLRLGPSPASSNTAPIVIEKVSDFETEHGRDGDGDGYGGVDDTVATACVPPAGYVDNVADCDDGDPAVHPEAEEHCEGTDENCNGIVDDGACIVSGGGCAAPPARNSSAWAWAVMIALGLVIAGSRTRRRRGRR